MAEISADCPQCGTKNSLSHYEGTENGAPHGAGYWPMPISITDQNCDCELSDAEFNAAMQKAWEPIQAQMDADNDAYAAELERGWDDDPTPTQPVYHAPGCYCGGSILCIP